MKLDQKQSRDDQLNGSTLSSNDEATSTAAAAISVFLFQPPTRSVGGDGRVLHSFKPVAAPEKHKK